MGFLDGTMEVPKGVLIKPEDFLDDVVPAEYSEAIYENATYHISGQLLDIMQQWILSKFPGGYFKFLHKSTGSYLRLQQIKFPRPLLRKEKPILAIAPVMHTGEESRYLFQSSFFRENTGHMEDIAGEILMSFDSDELQKNISMIMVPKDLAMTVRALFIFNSRGVAYDASTILENSFSDQRNYSIPVVIDIPLPENALGNIGDRFGFTLDKFGKLEDPEGFLDWARKYFNAPLSYKMDTSMQRKRLFITVEYDIMVTCTSSGYSEIHGKADTGMTVDMRVQGIKPSYFIMKSTDIPIVKQQVDENQVIDKFNTNWIPGNDLASKTLVFESEVTYEKEHEQATFNLNDIIEDSLKDFITWADTNSIPRTDILNILYYKDRALNEEATYTVDYSGLTLTETDGMPEQHYWIGIYIDREKYNQYTTEITEADNSLYVAGR